MPRPGGRSRQPPRSHHRAVGVPRPEVHREEPEAERGLTPADIQRRRQGHRVLARPSREPAAQRRVRPRPRLRPEPPQETPANRSRRPVTRGADPRTQRHRRPVRQQQPLRHRRHPRHNQLHQRAQRRSQGPGPAQAKPPLRGQHPLPVLPRPGRRRGLDKGEEAARGQ